ncbi:hypothetical protein HPP92_023856 [Vanilla planifolia]|uniref:Uncharacterized protein n=1 Tax=Vanilla planifolia TaxID=51239 RepID=A0A835UCE1_VANPL|nr:hypothetical protein HPP92_024215 [Vanilla planifolia]KAG0456068.1 hypothetical protein HPP92_023856 [Vanilla planifolia]
MSIDEKTKDHPNDVNRKKRISSPSAVLPAIVQRWGFHRLLDEENPRDSFAEPHADTSEKKKATVRGSLKSGREAHKWRIISVVFL